MAGNQFVSTFLSGAGNSRNEHPVFFDASHQLLHGWIVPNAVGVQRVRVQIFQRHTVDDAQGFRRFLWHKSGLLCLFLSMKKALITESLLELHYLILLNDT